MRPILRPIFCATLRLFFRRVEVFGADRVPVRGPVIFVLNHPNALIDPLFLVCRAPRRVSFLAKEPLFRMPVIGYFVRAFESLPVYRRQDEGADLRRNRETFEHAAALLARGRAIAIFPEGTSHSDPRLKPLKTGAARIALGAGAVAAESVGPGAPIHIIPAGLYYTAKGTFRSAALLYFGEPIDVSPQPLGPDGNPPRRDVRDLTHRIASALAEVTLQAEGEEALGLIGRAVALFSANGGSPGLAGEFELRRRLLAGYDALRRRAPDRLAAVQARLVAYERALRRAGLDARVVRTAGGRTGALAKPAAMTLLRALALLPFGLPGAILHYPPYRLAGFLAMRYGDTADVLATVKTLAALLCFPAAWIAYAGVVGAVAGMGMGLASLIVLPFAGYAGLLFVEALGELAASARALALFLLRPRAAARLAQEGRALRDEIVELRTIAESS